MAGIQFVVTLEDSAATRTLAALSDGMANMTPLMDAIGRALVAGANERIGTTNVSPDGSAWQASHRVRELGGKTLLKSGELRGSITSEAGADHVVVGSSTPYAAVHQFGAATGSLGVWSGPDKNGRNMTVASPWGDIPARPYLGISDEEELKIFELVRVHYGDIVEALQ